MSAPVTKKASASRDAPPPRKLPTWLIWASVIVVVAVVAVVIGLAAGGGSGGKKGGGGTTTSGALDDKAACQLVKTAVGDGDAAMAAIKAHPDGSTVDKAGLARAIAALQQVVAKGPIGLRANLNDALSGLSGVSDVVNKGAKPDFDALAYASASQGLLNQCTVYTG